MDVSQIPLFKAKAFDALSESDDLADVEKLYGLRADAPTEYVALVDVNDWDHEYATLGPEAAIDESFSLRLVVWSRVTAGDSPVSAQQEATERCFEIFEYARTVLRAPEFIANAGFAHSFARVLVQPQRFREIPYLDGQAAYIDALIECQTRI